MSFRHLTHQNEKRCFHYTTKNQQGVEFKMKINRMLLLSLKGLILSDYERLKKTVCRVKPPARFILNFLYVAFAVAVAVAVLYLLSLLRGNLSGWISSVSDMLVAYAAIRGLMYARKWKQTATLDILKSEGAAVIRQVHKINAFIRNPIHVHILKRHLEYKPISHENTEELINKLSSIAEFYSEYEMKIVAMESHLEHLETHGWIIEGKKALQFINWRNRIIAASGDLKYIEVLLGMLVKPSDADLTYIVQQTEEYIDYFLRHTEESTEFYNTLTGEPVSYFDIFRHSDDRPRHAAPDT
ncbi:hypothetical protein L585_13980 [Pantoea ananatis BRT175]|uniref:hypothetical protein n=1 Tax=Pantoea ananas TaxID=553 RepID=UPI0003B189FF|nr:hypothetical protein [Pantoea ananatis]ERM13363.1 hypothetical protein L585_13980 [Pantoea ananatis BRT175]